MTKTLSVRPEHKETTNKSKKFDAKPGLYTGVSAVALMLGAAGGSAVADPGITVTKPTTSVVIGTKQTPDFLDIEAPVTNNVINNGSIGPGDSPSLIVDGPNGGSVGGDIINNGLITGTMAGIFVSSTAKNTDLVGGGIFNFGTINVVRGTKTKLFSSAFGVVVSGPAVVTSVSNTGFIGAALFATGTGHTAGGVLISSSGSLASSVTNSGFINGFGIAFSSIGGDAQMLAFGVAQTNTSLATGPATSNTLTNSPGGFIGGTAVAIAGGSGTATAKAAGVGQIGIGTSATANTMSVSNATSATIGALASAFAVNGTARASAIGVGQSATGGLSITQNVNNSGTVNARANASVSATLPGFNTAIATATGISQSASGSASISQTITNSGAVNAVAVGSAGATTLATLVNANASTVNAFGLVQVASGTTAGAISQTITNSSQGSINVTASAFGVGSTSPDAGALANGVSQSATGAASNAVSLNNAGTINVNALASASGTTFPTATASAGGVIQFVGGGANNTASVVNSGLIDVDASASAQGASVNFAHAAAIGAVQVGMGSASATNFDFDFVNTTSGVVNVNANAFVDEGTGANSAVAAGVFQVVTAAGPANVTMDVINSGAINVTAFASATTSTATATAVVPAGVFQFVTGLGSASPGAALTFNNTPTGSLSVLASASVVPTDTAIAVASANGVTQGIVGGGAVLSANINNDSNINVTANAFAFSSDDSATATASAFGIAQFITGTSGTTNASVNFNNSVTGSLVVNANATATATSSEGEASALASGIFQSVNFGADISASVVNDGLIDVNAVANAVGSTSATATATAVGISQHVHGTAGTTNASVSLTNSLTGSISVNASAIASNNSDSTVFASANATGIFQHASGFGAGGNVSASILNDGSISVLVLASASNASGGSSATASVDVFGISQSATGGSGSANVSVSLINSVTGSIDIQASAIAFSSGTDEQFASASVNNGIYQDASGGGTVVTASLLNAGSIHIGAFASAVGSGPLASSATASAFVDGISQFAFGTTGSTTISVALTNSATGSIDIAATAIARSIGGTSEADASATANGIVQRASGGGTNVSASLSNDGMISIVGFASGFASGSNVESATASAFIDGISQRATGSSGSTNVTVSLTNSATGSIDIRATALAFSNGTEEVQASATIEGIYQRASGGGTNVTTSIINAGSINIIALASAIGSGSSLSEATASAFVDGITQTASGTSGSTTVSNTLANSATGSITIKATAIAFSSGTSSPTASATVEGISQTARTAGETVSNTITNDGSILISAFASASGVGGSVDSPSATAFVDGISQFANGSSGSTTVSNTLTNSATGSIDIMATAIAFSQGTGEVFATADVDGVLQSATGGGTNVTNTFTNDGHYFAGAFASGVGTGGSITSATASAFAYGASQIAVGTANSVNVSNTLTNSGTNSFEVRATALAFSSGTEEVEASAVATGVNQNASGGGANLSNTVTNDGRYDIFASASAFGALSATSATAFAIVRIGTQRASGTSNSVNVSNTFTNTVNGTINGTALAFARDISSSAEATASVVGIRQFNQAGGANLSNTISNSGAISLNASAQATAPSTYASGTAWGFVGVQRASGSANTLTATNTFTNSSTGSVSLNITALATVGTGSNAFASATGSGLFQFARTATDVSNTFNNDGSFSLNFLAVANATDATASVSTFGAVIQAATADGSAGSTATNVITNTSFLSFDVSAVASAFGTDSAFASVIGTTNFIQQNAFGGDTVSNSFSNSGGVSATYKAFASATDGTATAFVYIATDDAFIDQAANANGVPGSSATNTFSNSGSFTVLGQATAIGFSSASASVSLGSTFAFQRAFGETANSTFNNSGDLTVSLIANATDVSGNATASARFSENLFDLSASAPFGTFSTAGSAVQSFSNSSDGTISFLASANAHGSTFASADAKYTDELFDLDATGYQATSNFTNDGTMSFSALAFASATFGTGTSGTAIASASFTTDFMEQSANAAAGGAAGSVATANFTNSGTFNLLAQASAIGVNPATFTKVSANAGLNEEFIEQDARGETATTNFTNSGLLSASLIAFASDVTGSADAEAIFGDHVFQQSATAAPPVFGTAGAATVNFTNTGSGTISLFASASAVGLTWASADASVLDTIIDQFANGHNATANIVNNGTFNVTMVGFASAPSGSAFAEADISKGVEQTATRSTTTGAPGGTSTSTFTNTSNTSFDISLTAKAFGEARAIATASVSETYIFQGAFNNETSTVLLNNTGSMNLILDALASAPGNGTTGSAEASASLERGIWQSATAAGGVTQSASVELTNRGSIVMKGHARAVGSTSAQATVSLQTPVWQIVSGGNQISALFNNNTGSYSVVANATATGGTFASANALASRVFQTLSGTTAATNGTLAFLNQNSASFVVDANALAVVSGTGAQATAQATALGVSQRNTGSATQPVYRNRFWNEDEPAFTGEPDTLFRVHAFASAAGGTATNTAFAYAEGFRIFSNTNSHSILDIKNGSRFKVTATAIGSTANASAYGMVLSAGEFSGTINNSGNFDVKASAPGGTALAVGVQMNSAINNSVFTNTGNIHVQAIGSTTAIAVQYNFLGGHTLTATSLDQATFINDGGHVKAEVNSGGTLDFGTAFDFSNAPNAVLLDLRGTNNRGNIFGNILLSDDDTILVNNGMTIYRGMINGTLTFNGFLTIGSGGTLTLASTATGPSVGYFDTYTNTSTGTLAFNVTPSTPSTGLGQINAVEINLAGNVQLNVAPGLYANSQTYQDVVTFSTKNGTFDNAVTNSNTPLLTVQDIYPGDGTVDLALIRNPFNLVPGLTINQMGAASGIEGGYSTGLTGAFGSMVSSLFTLSTNAYIGALEQLHGAEHVQNLRTNLWSMDLLNYALDERINAGTFSNDGAHNRDSVIRRGDWVAWGKYQGMFGDLEGDIEASGYEQRQNAFYGGFDYALSDDFLIGFAAGLYRSRLDFTNGSQKKDEGTQLAIYGAWDTQTYYLRANAALAYYNVESMRPISLPTVNGTAMGRYDVNVFSFHAEGGRRFALDENVFFTPFVGINYARAKNDPFSETGADGANLFLPENSVKSFSGDIGARLAAAYETGSKSIIVPEVSFRYRHEFKDEILSINHAFDGVANSGFSVISSFVDSSMFIAQGGVSFSQGDRVEVKLMYTGRFNSQITDHGVGIRLSVLLGGRN